MSEDTEQTTDFLSTRKAAVILGVALSTIQLWVETGVLPAWKTVGGHRRIPRAAVEEMANKQKLISAVPLSAKQVNIAKILVVEDDAVQLEVYRHHFAEWDLPFELLTASDGFDGLMAIGRESPDLIITDLRMPGMDGFRMIRHLRGKIFVNDSDIIVVTALEASEMEAARALLPGIPIFSKPVPFIALRLLIENKLDKLQKH
jgi:excisionase family DNA binding protein